MKNRIVWFLGMMLALAVPAWAQPGSVGGTVRDAAGAPLPGVNVVLGGTTRGDATDAAGRYRIDVVPAGTYTLRASSLGYRPETRSVTIPPGAAITVDFVLEDAPLESGEVVVTAARRAQRFAEVPISLHVVAPRELEERNILALDEALRYVPGVQVAENQVNVRGSSGFSFNTGSRVLMLLDGMPLLAPDREAIPFDALPMAQVARIEVVKGPGSALYGGGALGGVIHVITKDFPETPETAVRLFGGAYEPVRYARWRAAWSEAGEPRPFGGGTFTHARRFGRNAGAWLNVSYRFDDGYLNFGAERDLDVFLKIGGRPAATLRLDLLGGWTRRTHDTFLYWNGLRDPLNPGELNFGRIVSRGTNDSRTNTVTLVPSLTHAVNGRFSYTARGRLVGVVIQPLADDGTPGPVDDGTAGLRYGGEFQLNWIPRLGAHLTAGLAGDALATESSFFQPDSVANMARSQPEGAAFLQLEQKLFDRLDVVAGLRYDVYEIDTIDVARKLSPKLSAALSLAEGRLHLRAAYGQGFRVPSLGERLVENSSFLPLVSNLDLRPEESTGYELGLRSIARLFHRLDTQADLALFWTDYRRLVEPKFVPEEQAFQFVNLTKARIRGLEAGLEAATEDDRWRLAVSYTLLDAEDLTDDAPLVFRSKHLFKAGLRVPLLGPLSAGLDYRYASAPDRVDSDFSRFARNADVVEAQHVVDARLSVQGRHLGLAVLFNNALEYYYVERPAILAPPRHLVVQLQTRF